uniref:OO_Ba0013J05-OO_Ba0033A15.8 protein n=1 Tax=Oryza officinalis TaxID=4535 RepID=D0ABF1_9ORYZ|nr:OO_Ba0013J05-OO_Ba0033A15.8 [Oryza officinalis]
MASAASSALLLPNSRAPAPLSRRRAPGPAQRRGFVVGFEGRSRRGAAGTVRASFNPLGDERILREALKEPVAFMGGVFAGLLRLDLNEDPLKEWITRTVEASGIAEDSQTDESSEGSQNDVPQQIEIE